jgi:two-component system, OmpR family, response regulator QseB
MRILLLEDDQQLGKALTTSLGQHEFKPVWVRRVIDARTLLETEVFSAVLLDIGLPDGSGLDILKEIRAARKNVPVIMLTALETIQDRIVGLDSGADDYLGKPFAFPELLSRIRAVIRRSAGFSESIWRIGPLSIDVARHCALLDEATIDLSLREYTLLLELIRNSGQYVTRTQLENVLFGADNQLAGNSLEVHIHHLRKKIGPINIRTIRGVGYRLEEAK